MLKIESRLRSLDNLGVLVGKCLHVYKGSSKKSSARLGDLILLSVRKKAGLIDKKKIKAFVAHTTHFYAFRKSGHGICFQFNKFITLSDDHTYPTFFVQGAVPAEFLFGRLVNSLFLLTTTV